MWHLETQLATQQVEIFFIIFLKFTEQKVLHIARQIVNLHHMQKLTHQITAYIKADSEICGRGVVVSWEAFKVIR